MAEKLQGYTFHTQGHSHPWHKWLDGDVWRVGRGKDFKGSLQAFAVTARRNAKKRGLRVRINFDETGEGVILQAYKREDAGASGKSRSQIETPAQD